MVANLLFSLIIAALDLPPSPPGDLVFREVQEVWARGASYRTPRVLWRLGAPSCDTREYATRRLTLLGFIPFDDLAAGASLDPDPEVRHRCTMLLDRLYRCRRCDWVTRCLMCGSTGDVRYEREWGTDEPKARRMFGEPEKIQDP